MTTGGPAQSRWLLGRELRTLREAAGVIHEQAAERIECSKQKIYRVEQGISAHTVREVDGLLKLYRADDEAAERVRIIAAQARRRGSFGKVPDWSRQFFGLQEDAAALDMFSGELIPGLFQTETYARELISQSKLVAPSDVESVVQARMRQQTLLERKDPLSIHAVMSQSAIQARFGKPGDYEEQLNKLVEISRLPHVTLQIMPFSLHAALGVPFTLLTLNVGDEEARWVYLSDLTRGECRSDAKQVGGYQLTFGSLIVNALGESETLDLLNRSRDGR